MYDANIDLNPSPDWIKCASAKAWARAHLPSESIPSFGSSARRKLQQSIADDEAEIMQIEDSIRSSILKLQALQDRVCRNRARLAPIRLLPNETLSAIFLHWLDSRDSPSPPRIYFSPPSPLMKVCRRWKACVISTPEIWTHAKYRIDASDIACFDQLGIFRSYFDRSGSRDLKVYFTHHNHWHYYAADDIWQELVVPALRRIESLTICGTYKNLHLPDAGLDRKFVRSLTLCTRLSELVLSDMEFWESEYQTTIVLPTVQTIEYYSCSGDPPIQCPGLVVCEINQCFLSSKFTLSLCTISLLLEKVILRRTYMEFGREVARPTFLSLKHLEIDCCDEEFPDCFVDAPNISRLDLHFNARIFSKVIESISLSSFSVLTSLTLTKAHNMVMLPQTDVQNMHEWMAHSRNLVEFGLVFEKNAEKIYEEYGMNMFMDPLLTTKRGPPCFPHLKHVTIEGSRGLIPELYRLMLDRATDAERAETRAGSVCRVSPSIVQRPCLLTLVDSDTLPDMESVGLMEFLDSCRTHWQG